MTLGRAAGPERSAVGPIELFFDLVYVFAIVQISHLLISDLSWRGFAQTAVVFAAIWWGWNYTAWMMNWLDPARGAVQLLNAVLMLLALGMAAAIPLAFDGGGVLFVACYVAMGLIRPLFMMIAFRGPLARNYRFLGAWSASAGVLWLVGAFLPADLRLAVWLLAVIVDYLGPRVDFRFPGLGSAPMSGWDTDAEHLAERNRLVFIIALGESVLLMGGSLAAAGSVDTRLVVGFIVGFAALVSLWFNYFALAGHDVLGGEEGTAALRSAYAYAHALMVGGAILVAVSIELRLTHPHLSMPMVLVTIAGPLVYLLGNVLFLNSRFGRVARTRYVAIVALVLIGAAATIWRHELPVIGLSLAVLAVVGGLAVRTVLARPRGASHPSSTLWWSRPLAAQAGRLRIALMQSSPEVNLGPVLLRRGLVCEAAIDARRFQY